MSPALPLRAALTRGAIVAFANWPIIFVEFVVESLYKVAIGVPIVGAAFMVALLLGTDIRALLGEGVLAAAERLLGPLATAPVALAAFLVALSLVGVGGAVLMFMVKGGTLGVLGQGEARAGDFSRRPFAVALAREARAYSLTTLWTLTRRFQRRAATLACWLGAAYIVIGGLYLTVVGYGFQWVASSAWASAWPLLVLIATSAAVVSIVVVNLFFDLTRVVIVVDDCGAGEALRRVRAFLLVDARQVLGIFGAMGGLLLLGMALSITATLWLTLIAWVPLIGLLIVPLQIAFWITRGLVFQYLSLVTLAAYQSQYRRFSTPALSAVPFRIQQA